MLIEIEFLLGKRYLIGIYFLLTDLIQSLSLVYFVLKNVGKDKDKYSRTVYVLPLAVYPSIRISNYWNAGLRFSGRGRFAALTLAAMVPVVPTV